MPLEKEVGEKVKDALRPFAAVADLCEGMKCQTPEQALALYNCRRAREALTALEEEK